MSQAKVSYEHVMTLKYDITFESETNPLLRYKGQVEGTSAATCARRAVAIANKAKGKYQWSSVVILLSK